MYRRYLMIGTLAVAALATVAEARRSSPGGRRGASPGVRAERVRGIAYTSRPMGKVDQIEVGGPFVGVELHKGSACPTRFSFFHPVQTTIENARKGYWKRADFPVMELGLKAGEGRLERFGKGQFSCEELTPYRTRLVRKDGDKEVRVSYEFCKTRPATVVTYRIKNTSKEAKPFSLFTRLLTSIHSSQNFNLIDKAWTEYGKREAAIYTHFDGEAPDTCLFVGNAGQAPSSFTSNGEALGRMSARPLPGKTISRKKPTTPVSAFAYDKVLRPGQSMCVVQLIGTARSGEAQQVVKEVKAGWRREVRGHEKSVVARVNRAGTISSGDRAMDRSARVCKAILANSEHNLDGARVPMPCPAQYPYEFTHDILMKNLAMAIFDPKVVKRDLKHIAANASAEGLIPHARYWKTDRYTTEYAKADNWNHFWFNLVSSRYLRHSGDRKTLKTLYPLLQASVKQMLINRRAKGVINANRPDWWDAGDSFGPRSYMTILAIRALREFLYVSAVLGQTGPELRRYEKIAAEMQQAMQQKLWDPRKKYLVNFNKGGKKDPHYYTGSMLAAHFDLIDPGRKRELIDTAGRKLLDEKVGVYNAFPMDFAQKKQREFLKLKDGEQGTKSRYFNGGIWYHGNAWYALGLIATGQKAAANKFIKQTMTVDGIMNGPNGQPAMYECRSGKRNDPSEYGKVDKPQFMWASSWYLYTLYNLLGLRENTWNVSFAPNMAGKRQASYSINVGGRSVPVKVSGSGSSIRSVTYDGQLVPSTVLPHDLKVRKGIEIVMGAPDAPYLAASESMLRSSTYDRASRTLTARLQAFAGHRDRVTFVSPQAPRQVLVDGKPLKSWSSARKNGAYQVEVELTHRAGVNDLSLQL